MLKIGEFSQEAQVSIKTLRYYDRVGLLKPAWKDRFSGYRYYHRTQLEDLKRILALKKLGFSLEQIQTIVQEDLSLSQLRVMLALKQAELEKEISANRARLAEVEAQLQQLENHAEEQLVAEVQFPVELASVSTTANPLQEKSFMEVKIRTKPAFTVAGAEYHGKNQNNEIKAMWSDEWPRISKLPHTVNEQHCYGVCGDLEDDGSFRYVAGFEVSKTDDLPEGMVGWEIPEQTYAVFPCTLDGIHQAYEYAHGTWMPENGYKRADGPDFELYDEAFDPETPEAILHVYIPVKK
jgi:predicted transcriptional regulator YdeE/DNA-binding transcriptional MerR regulator